AALEAVRPAAVDVGSGVESSPGRKDRRKMAEFIRQVRAWDNGNIAGKRNEANN
ncbi:MAG: N-(5'-phosphoribosyl)anthranilate isomerase, partial [Clostridia bacterium]|nr:N-(5'-phosphoribosyl)anthranilate isomerase [Clostridia bacterium]